MNAHNLAVSLAILAEYDREAPIAAEHDRIWVGVEPDAVSDEDCHRLGSLGWWVDDDTWTHFV
jgi:hypothetical protein